MDLIRRFVVCRMVIRVLLGGSGYGALCLVRLRSGPILGVLTYAIILLLLDWVYLSVLSRHLLGLWGPIRALF